MAVEIPETSTEIPAMESSIADTKQRVLNVAEALFMERGYSAITLRDIADALEIKQASLYYHFPDGKEQIFTAVAGQVFTRHQVAIEAAIESVTGKPETRLADRLGVVLVALLELPPMNLTSLMHADMPVLTEKNRACLTRQAHDSIFAPLRNIFAASQAGGEIRDVDVDIITGAFLSIIDGLRFRQTQVNPMPVAKMAEQLVDVLMDGLRNRTG